MSMKVESEVVEQGRSELSEDEVVSTSSIQLNEELVKKKKPVVIISRT